MAERTIAAACRAVALSGLRWFESIYRHHFQRRNREPLSSREDWPADCSFNTMSVWPADPVAREAAMDLDNRFTEALSSRVNAAVERTLSEMAEHVEHDVQIEYGPAPLVVVRCKSCEIRRQAWPCTNAGGKKREPK